MSGFLAPVARVFHTPNRILEDILITTHRSLGTIVPNVVVEEQHRDELLITEHPIEQGAAISDHAYKRPAEVTMRCGWSNSSPYSDGTEDYIKDVYQLLLKLQASAVPFNLVTGKRVYRDMLVSSLNVQNDAAAEYALLVVATLRQIIRVQTQSVTLAPQPAQKNPDQSSPTIDNGTKQPTSVPTTSNGSVLSKIFGHPV